MKTLAIAALCLGVATPVLAQSVGEKTGVNSMLGVTPSTQDFVTEAAQSDMFEIQSSQLAQEKKDPKAGTFAQKMISDHTGTTDAIKAMVQSGKVKATLPTALDSSHQSKLDKLKGLSGADFEKQYRSDQVSGHKDAVSLYKRYADGGDNPDLKAFAQKTLPTLEQHQKMAQDLAD
jgi:putative membrane protein